MPVLVKDCVSPATNVISLVLIGPTLSSFSSPAAIVIVTLPVFCTTYVQVTASPTLRYGPLILSASKPLVYFFNVNAGLMAK